MSLANRAAIERTFHMLAAQLEAAGSAPIGIAVIGGAALNMLGVVVRPTRDVDVLSLVQADRGGSGIVLVKSSLLPNSLLDAAVGVARNLGLEDNWLNSGPADLLDHGLPEGFERRLAANSYGPSLTIHIPAREDLICFKVYAAADTGVGRHTQDLAALEPTDDELLAGARWTRSQDPSEGFKTMLVALLRFMGADNAAERLSDDE